MVYKRITYENLIKIIKRIRLRRKIPKALSILYLENNLINIQIPINRTKKNTPLMLLNQNNTLSGIEYNEFPEEKKERGDIKQNKTSDRLESTLNTTYNIKRLSLSIKEEICTEYLTTHQDTLEVISVDNVHLTQSDVDLILYLSTEKALSSIKFLDSILPLSTETFSIVTPKRLSFFGLISSKVLFNPGDSRSIAQKFNYFLNSKTINIFGIEMEHLEGLFINCDELDMRSVDDLDLKIEGGSGFYLHDLIRLLKTSLDSSLYMKMGILSIRSPSIVNSIIDDEMTRSKIKNNKIIKLRIEILFLSIFIRENRIFTSLKELTIRSLYLESLNYIVESFRIHFPDIEILKLEKCYGFTENKIYELIKKLNLSYVYISMCDCPYFISKNVIWE